MIGFLSYCTFKDRLRLDEVIIRRVIIHNEVFEAYDYKGNGLEWNQFTSW